MLSNARAIADKFIARDGAPPALPSSAIIWAPIRISDRERDWLTKAVLRGGYVPLRDRDGESAPFLSDLRLMNERGLIKGMPWRVTKFGRDCLRELETQVKPRTPQLAPEIQKPAALNGTIRRLADVERELIKAAISQCNGNKTHAARALGISVRTIRNKVRLYAATT